MTHTSAIGVASMSAKQTAADLADCGQKVDGCSTTVHAPKESSQQEWCAKLQKAERRQIQIKPAHWIGMRPQLAQRHLNLLSNTPFMSDHPADASSPFFFSLVTAQNSSSSRIQTGRYRASWRVRYLMNGELATASHVHSARVRLIVHESLVSIRRATVC